MKMATSDFSITLSVEQTPNEAFKAINRVRAWWSEDMEGTSQELNDEFTVSFFDDLQVSTQKLIEVIPDKKVVWLVKESSLKFLEDTNEWTGTKIIFEIFEKDGKTQIHFTHVGLVPQVECYKDCVVGWKRYVTGSLLYLITDGVGKPELKLKAANNLFQSRILPGIWVDCTGQPGSGTLNAMVVAGGCAGAYAGYTKILWEQEASRRETRERISRRPAGNVLSSAHRAAGMS